MLLDELMERLSATVPNAETLFVHAPKDRPYAVWDVVVHSIAADECMVRREYTARITLVEHMADGRAARDALEESLDTFCLDWSRGERGWDEAERVFATDYECSWETPA